jgi:lactoylglutathione lyase
MKFCWTTISVSDMGKSVAFYSEIVGLPVVNRLSAGPDTEITFLGDAETKIELICHRGGPGIRFGEDISLGFEVPSLDQMMAFIQGKGIPIHSGPFAPNPHTKFFFVTDPDGLKIQFVEHS